VYSILVGCFVAGVVGAKGAQLASDGVSGVGAGSALSGAGFGVFGAFAAGALYLSAYFRIVRPTPTLIATLDAGAAAIAANLAIGRLGCLLYGCCHGRPTNAPWPLSIALDTFAPTSPARLAHAAAEPGTRLWASQPLELVGAAVLAFALHRAARGSLAGTGRAVGVAALAYGLLRFGLEFLRDDSAAVLGPFNAWQLASVFLASWGAHRLSHSYSLRRSQA
jgi:phosphatidylglycerol:prolipoprotein diacylglycerol transferase